MSAYDLARDRVRAGAPDEVRVLATIGFGSWRVRRLRRLELLGRCSRRGGSAGERQVLGVAVGPSEDRAFWTAFLRSLVKARPGRC